MKLPFRHHRKISRGQALVEFALILPLLLLLLVMGLDLGRVFFGWVGLQNSARIGANYAAIHPDAWSTPDSAVKQLARAQYREQMSQDARALNCDLDVDNDGNIEDDLPLPVFVNVTGTVNPREMGDHASITLQCGFGLITPLANGIFGGGIQITANAVFTVRGGPIANIPTPGPLGSPTPTPAGPTPTPTPTPTANPCLAPIAGFSAAPTSGPKTLTVSFTDTSIAQGCPVLTWSWNFGDGTAVVTTQSPTHMFVNKGNYDVTLTVTSAAGPNSTVVNNYIHVSN